MSKMYPKWHELQHMDGFKQDKICVLCQNKQRYEEVVKYFYDKGFVGLRNLDYYPSICICVATERQKDLSHCGIDYFEKLNYVITEFK